MKTNTLMLCLFGIVSSALGQVETHALQTGVKVVTSAPSTCSYGTSTRVVYKGRHYSCRSNGSYATVDGSGGSSANVANAMGVTYPISEGFKYMPSITDSPYNARADATTDNYTPIQSAIDNACLLTQDGTTGQGASLYFPGGPTFYAYSKPLLVNCSRLMIYGQNLATQLLPKYSFGPAIVVRAANPSYPAFPTSTALVGDGNAMALTSAQGSRTKDGYLDLAEVIQSGSLNNATALTIEANIKVTTTTGDSSVLSSWGQKGRAPSTSAFTIRINSGGTVYATMNVGGKVYTEFGLANISANKPYHIALAYDGRVIRFFINGILQNSTAVVGQIKQSTTENISLGAEIGPWPLGAVKVASITGTVDNVRISSIARYTSNFNPPSVKFTSDGTTLLLLTFTSQFDSFTRVKAGVSRSGWLMVRWPRQTSFQNEDVVSNLTIRQPDDTGGILAYQTVNSQFNEIEINGGMRQLSMENNDFESSMYHVVTRAGRHSEWDILLDNASGVFKIDRPLCFGGTYQIVINGDLSASVYDPWLQTESATVESLVFLGGGQIHDKILVVNPIINSESGGAALTELVYLSNIGGQVNFINGYFEAIPTVPAFTIYGGNQILIQGSTLFGSSSAGENINILSAPAVPVQYFGNIRSSTTQPITNDYASVVAGPGGYGFSFSAAGTPLPTCDAAMNTNNPNLIVSDARSPTYMGPYVSGGATTTNVVCSYNGRIYSWLTH